MPSGQDLVTLRVKIEDARDFHGSTLTESERAEITDNAASICDQNGIGDALEWIETLFQSYWQAERLSTRLAISQVNDHIRDLGIRIDALDAGKAAASVAHERAQSANKFPSSAQIDAKLNRPTVREIHRKANEEEQRYAFVEKYPRLTISLDDFQKINAPQMCLSEDQLPRLDQGLNGYYVTEWKLIVLAQQPQVLRCLMPFRVPLFPLALGPEITRDWLYPRAGHGFPIKDIHASWQNIVKFNVEGEPSTGGNVIFQLNKKRFVVNGARDTVITYFDTAYGT